MLDYRDVIAHECFEITFYGVRGSTPCHGPDIARYGGNTSCVAVSVPDHCPVFLDFGTGARYYGNAWPDNTAFDGHCLLTHFHWDHVQGLPFFPPLLRKNGHVTVHGPRPDESTSLLDVIAGACSPPTFPVGVTDLGGEITFVEHADDQFSIGELAIMSRIVPHIGPTLGYRLEWGGFSVAYISDHQQPDLDTYSVDDSVTELASGVDLLIHDAQFVRAEYSHKADWGHSTLDYAAWLAEQVGAHELALFHHDPAHDDDQIDHLVDLTRSRHPDLELFAAAEGMTYRLGVGLIP